MGLNFKAVRNFHCFGRDVVAGESVELTPPQADALLRMGGTIKPAGKESRRACHVEPALTWGPPVHLQEPDAGRGRIHAGRSDRS